MKIYNDKDQIEYSYNAPATWWTEQTAYQLKWQIEVDVEKDQSTRTVSSHIGIDGQTAIDNKRTPPEYEEDTRFFVTENALNLSSGEVIRGRSTLIWLARSKADAIANRPAVCGLFA
jgi:hypothetical protein